MRNVYDLSKNIKVVFSYVDEGMIKTDNSNMP